MNRIAQGDIYLVHDASGKHRPFVVVSRSELNRGRYCLAVPLTTRRLDRRRTLRNCVFLEKGSFGLPKACVAQAEAATLLRQSDIVRPIQRVGKVSPSKLEDLIDALGYVIGADCKPE